MCALFATQDVYNFLDETVLIESAFVLRLIQSYVRTCSGGKVQLCDLRASTLLSNAGVSTRIESVSGADDPVKWKRLINLPGRGISSDQAGWVPRARLVHCTHGQADLWDLPKLGSSTAQFLRLGAGVRATPALLAVPSHVLPKIIEVGFCLVMRFRNVNTFLIFFNVALQTIKLLSILSKLSELETMCVWCDNLHFNLLFFANSILICK